MTPDAPVVRNSGDPLAAESVPPAAHWKFWGTVLWGLLILGVFLGLQAAIVFWVLASTPGPLSESEFVTRYVSTAQSGYVFSLATIVTAVVGCLLIAGVIKLKKHSVLGDYLALSAVPRSVMLRWLVLLAGLIVVADVVTVHIGRPIVPEFMSEVYASAQPVWTLWVALLVAAPLFEETFFRGFLFRGFESSFLGAAGTVLLTAGLWALLHVQYDAFGISLVFTLGLLLGIARARTGSLWLPLALHSAANLVATVETAVLT
jgi:membrane protease YdiL (CAAX protease family)